jgi:hypothetical protein
MRSSNPAEKAMVEKLGVVYPNQSSWRTQQNNAGGAEAKNSKISRIGESSGSSKAKRNFNSLILTLLNEICLDLND